MKKIFDRIFGDPEKEAAEYREELKARGIKLREPGELMEGDFYKSLNDFNRYLQEDLQFSHSENLLDAVEENLENLTAQKILDSQDNRFLEAYSVIEKVLKRATHLDLKRLNDVILKENICCINEIDDLLSRVIEEIHQERKLKDSEELQFRINMLKRDLNKDLSSLLEAE